MLGRPGLGRIQVVPEEPLRPAGAAAGDDLLAGDDHIQAEVVVGLEAGPDPLADRLLGPGHLLKLTC